MEENGREIREGERRARREGERRAMGRARWRGSLK